MEESKITIWKNNFKRRFKNEPKFSMIYVGIPVGIIISVILLVVFLYASDENFKATLQLLTTLQLCILVFVLNKLTKSKRIITEQKELLEEKNRQITDSIEYALRIQTAILPPNRLVKQYLSDSFIYYQPKDIVAGDFYWMDTVNDLVLFAACDCTGHGVPGAMVSVVCHNALNRAVREFGLTQPAAILDKTAQLVIENFEGSDTEIKDGMDISMCALNPQTRKLEWAGANNPLWLIQNNELIETKADKQSIGKGDDIKPFTNHEFDLSQGQSIYIFSDGFADQFGGEPERKITKRRFKELIVSLQNIPLHEQGKALEKYIADFKGSIHQTDDILVIGVRV